MSDGSIDERFVPGTSRIMEIESFHRYWVAAGLCRRMRVLDAASGEGYGSDILARVAADVTGVDLSGAAVENATGRYARDNLRFVVGDVLHLPFDDGSFDRVVSFETIEHLDDPQRFLSEVRRVLKPDGLLIVSSPNKTPFDHRNCKDGRLNPYHLSEMEVGEFERLLGACFPNIAVYGQDAFYNSIIDGEGPGSLLVKDGSGELKQQDELTAAQYSFALASAAELPRLGRTRYVDARFDDRYGFCLDDESVVNQFGLRGEFERLCAKANALEGDLSALRASNGAASRALAAAEASQRMTEDALSATKAELNGREGELAEMRVELKAAGEALASARAELKATGEALASTRAELKTAGDALASTRTELNAVRTALREEHAKSEYLYHEYTELQTAWSLRIFGRFHLRKRFRAAVLGAGSRIHRLAKRVFLALPFSYGLRFRIKNLAYGHLGFLFEGVSGYNEWRSIREVASSIRQLGDEGLRVPKDVPMTSIVIPVYNNLHYTLDCLRSIYGIGSTSPFEVIVVDDCSTEDQSPIARTFPAVRVLRNERNLGFLRTANRGAAAARGEYLIFLNNDTVVLPGWLDELTTALYGHPKAGMIGSQLIHMRTRRLQESGNLICRDGRILPLGRGESPDHPEYNYFREVDFSSAASIILRKRVFDEMNGFDEAYAPAYFEDPDLALRMQKAGYRNYVMPLSRVMHQEMASYGATLDERCDRNRKFFEGRWLDYLAGHALYDAPESRKDKMRFSRPRVLYIDAETPMADRGSGGMDAIFFMEYFLSRGYDVVFHGEYTPGFMPKYTPILLRMGVECVCAPERRIWEYIASAGWSFQLVFVSRIYQARGFDGLLKKHCPQAGYIFNTVDLHFVREGLEAELKGDPRARQLAEATKRYELQVAGAADATIVISKDEQRLLTGEYGLTNIWHIPQMREVVGRAETADRSGAVFIGSAHPPNMDGLRYFHDRILPLLPLDFRLKIVGGALRDAIGRMDEYKDLLSCPQFEFVGFVEDLGSVLDEALMTVAPLRYGAGTKGKVASSMAYGVPCVSSRFGTEGTGMVHGENILIASTPEEFASEIRALSSDAELWKRISDGGMAFLRENYSRAAVEGRMDDLLHCVVGRRRKSHWAATPVLPKVESA